MTPFRTAVAVAALAGLTACQNIPGLSSLTGSGSSGTSSTASGTSGGSGASTSMTAADQSFVTQATYGGLAEVALGETAQRRGASADVRDLGRMLATEHGRANEELAALARTKGMSPPTSPDAGRTTIGAALGRLEGATFDRQYLQQQLSEHDVTIALYESAARNATDSDVRAFANKWLPPIRQHADRIRTLTTRAVSSSR